MPRVGCFCRTWTIPRNRGIVYWRLNGEIEPRYSVMVSAMKPFILTLVLAISTNFVACTDDDADPQRPEATDAFVQIDAAGGATDSNPSPDSELDERPDDEWAGAWVIGRSLKGRPLVAEQYGIGGPVLFFMSGIHGNERSAVSWSERTRTLLLGGLAERHGIRILFMGAANPDGIAAGTRENANSIDLNRNFATENFGEGAEAGGDTPLSEPESLSVQEAFDTAMPSAVIAVHCCVPTFDYDGPALELATAMAQAMPESVRYPTERLGSKPGSFGSYVGVDHETPIITLEFAQHDYLDFFEQLDALELAIEAASQWTADNPMSGQPDSVSNIVEDSSNYRNTFVGSSASGLDLRLERHGNSDGLSVVLLSGLGRMNQDAFLVGEHLRRVLFSDASQVDLTVFTGINPDGVFTGSPKNADGFDISTDFAGEQRTSEAIAVRSVLEEADPDLVIWVKSDTLDRVGWTGREAELFMPSEFEATNISADPVVRRLREHSESVLVIGVGTQRGRVDLGQDDIFPETDPRPFSAMVRRLLLQDSSCSPDGYCDVLCPEDEDCDCPCDYNSACEAADRNSQETCGCDPNCFDGRRACDADQHCDTWCPEGVDPDCDD